jgi:hypothetical protein
MMKHGETHFEGVNGTGAVRMNFCKCCVFAYFYNTRRFTDIDIGAVAATPASHSFIDLVICYPD